MKNPGIIDGIIVAAIISLGAGASSLLLGGWMLKSTLLSLLLYGAALTYLIYLLRRAPARIGRVVMLGGWSTVTLACWLLQLPLFEQILLQAGFVWLVRALYFHGSLSAAALDLGLVVLGLGAGAWAAINTQSFTAALWSFFLVQALFCWIPDLARKQPVNVQADASSFQSAHRIALDAVRKLTQP